MELHFDANKIHEMVDAILKITVPFFEDIPKNSNYTVYFLSQ